MYVNRYLIASAKIKCRFSLFLLHEPAKNIWFGVKNSYFMLSEDSESFFVCVAIRFSPVPDASLASNSLQKGEKSKWHRFCIEFNRVVVPLICNSYVLSYESLIVWYINFNYLWPANHSFCGFFAFVTWLLLPIPSLPTERPLAL